MIVYISLFRKENFHDVYFIIHRSNLKKYLKTLGKDRDVASFIIKH